MADFLEAGQALGAGGHLFAKLAWHIVDRLVGYNVDRLVGHIVDRLGNGHIVCKVSSYLVANC